MRGIRHWSIRTKLVMLAVISGGVAVVLSGVGVTVNEIFTMRSFKQETLQSQAAMLGFNCTGVLSFSDAAAAGKLLASLQSQPSLKFACLYSNNGKLLAKYPSTANAPPTQPKLADDECRFTSDGDVEVLHPVLDRGEPVGSLYLRAGADDINAQLLAYAKLVIAVVAAAVLVSIPLAIRLQRSISRPILALAQTATKIGSLGDYSIRVEPQSKDELGTLCVEFNRMLEQVERSEQALKKAHEELEDRVLDRTTELRMEIAHHKKTQAELIRAKDDAEAANVAKSQFLANMSHEIRTPLNAIIGFADLLRRSGDKSTEAERRDYLDTIHTSGQHLLTLINDILDLSKVEADRLEVEEMACSPHEVINEVISVLRVRALEKGLSLEYEWLGGVPETIKTDPARFRQLLMNLVSNAVKFTAHGRVRVSARLVQDKDNPRLAIQVSDTGIGIPKSKFEEIFDPFVQADNSVTRQFGGTGLGLTICRRIAQALGGNVEVASEVGKGSTFTVIIATGPLDNVRILDVPPADGLRSRRHQQQGPLPSLFGIRVLLVEDGESNRKLLSLVLREVDAEVVTAENGKIGTDLALNDKFDLILMDMQMPVMDGYAATTLLRERGVTVPILALTAHAMMGDEQKCRAAGCTGYVTKPVNAELLVRTIAQTLGLAGQFAVGGERSGEEMLKAAARDCAPANGTAIYSTLPTENPAYLEIVQDFLPRLQEQLDAMRQALESGNFTELGQLAHWLKGAAGTVGFPAFTQPAKQLCVLVRAGQHDGLDSLVNELVELGKRVALQPEQTAEVSC